MTSHDWTHLTPLCVIYIPYYIVQYINISVNMISLFDCYLISISFLNLPNGKNILEINLTMKQDSFVFVAVIQLIVDCLISWESIKLYFHILYLGFDEFCKLIPLYAFLMSNGCNSFT